MSDKEYFAKRATDERARSESATDPRAAAVHAELAQRFEVLATNQKPRLRVVGGMDWKG